jgi:hypothetical protein
MTPHGSQDFVENEQEMNGLSLQWVNNPYMHDLQNTLEFDRQCRCLEALFVDLEARVNVLENKITRHKM